MTDDEKEPDLSDIPEAGEEWFAKAKLTIPSSYGGSERYADCGCPVKDHGPGLCPLLIAPAAPTRMYEAEIELITPERAEHLLANKLRNRRIDSEWVGHIIEVIRSGDLTEFNQAGPICLDSYGRLINGQHRLTAIVWSGIACRIPVIRRYHIPCPS